MRLFFIDLELKSIRLEASSSRSIFVYSSPQLVQINSALISVQSRIQIRMAVRQRNLSGAIHPLHPYRGLSHYSGNSVDKIFSRGKLCLISGPAGQELYEDLRAV
jgi:hypothetical protein